MKVDRIQVRMWIVKLTEVEADVLEIEGDVEVEKNKTQAKVDELEGKLVKKGKYRSG